MSSDAANLIDALVQDFEQGYGLGSMSCSVYDTAWISCVVKPCGAGHEQWLFPSSFRFILDSQHPDGGWHWPPHGTYRSVNGTILSSLAALFTIIRHKDKPLQLIRLQDEVANRLERGIQFVEREMKHLARTSEYSVGFDVLVPALLELLEGEGIIFHFTGRRKLVMDRDSKLSRVPLERLDRVPSTILHSLEALYGENQFSFESLRKRLVCGSMMASPAATSAYLMRCNEWDDSAEAYLRLALSNGAGQNSGGVPSAFPSTHFELTWVVSVLLKARCINSDLLEGDGGQLSDIFENRIQENGLVGFAPGIQPDVDDSANASIILNLLGKPGLSVRMREHFEKETHFETYARESNISISANCSILLALLLNLKHDPNAVSAIRKISEFLVAQWLNADRPIKDKWNVSEYYSSMLLAQAFMKLIWCWEAGELAPPDSELLRNQVVLLVVRSLVRVLLTQSSDGSWGSRGPCEETAYAILTLVELAGLPIASFFDKQIRSARLHGRNYLEAHRQVEQPEHLWVEKVLYGAQHISQAYILAALNAPEFPPMEGLRFNQLLNLDYRAMSKATRVFQKVPLLASQPRWLIEASWIEGRLFLPMLQEVRKAAFSRGGMTKDKYFAWIPTMWTLADNKNGTYTSTKLLYDMMRVSVLNFQVDEFMEAVLDAKHSENHSTVRNIIEDLFLDHNLPGGTENRSSNTYRPVLHARSINGCHSNKEIQIEKSFNNSTLEDQNTHESNANACPKVDLSISKSLQSFKTYITEIASAAGILPSTISRIHAELKAFLLAHLTQTQMNKEFSFYKRAVAAPLPNAPLVYQNSTSPSFRTWLFSIAAIHTSCHYSFVLYLALASAVHGGSPLLRTTSQQYVAADLCEHLAKMCRLYNDCGSLKRDLVEGNLNCVNFPGFQDEEIEDDNDQDNKEKVESDIQEKKLEARLMALADWERKGLDSAMEDLERNPKTDDRLMGALKLFVDVTDLFGQVYMVKDLASGKV